MNREIKYRAKVKMPERLIARKHEVPEGQWVYGEPHTIDCPTPHIHTVDVGKQPIDKDTIGQFTGVLDGRNQEIYENDIVATYFDGHCTYQGEVRFEAGRFIVSTNNGLLTNIGGKSWLVIGNIHDNPELMKGGEKCQ